MATTVQLTDDSESYTVADPTGETVFAGAGDDTITGGDGNDVIFGEDGNDQVFAGLGDDSISGANGDDLIFGELGNDTLSGGNGLDQLLGGLGNDSLDGGNGVDTLVGEQDDDTLTGGDGGDIFQFGFTMTEGTKTETFTGWLADRGLPTSGWTEDFFEDKYADFLQYLVAKYDLGVDKNHDGRIKVSINDEDPNGTPKIEGLSKAQLSSLFGDRQKVLLRDDDDRHHGHHEDDDKWYRGFRWDDDDRHGRDGKHGKDDDCDDKGHHGHFEAAWFSNSFTIASTPTVTGTDGHDVITDFDFTQGGDVLSFAGLGTSFTLAQFQDAFKLSELDANGDGTLDSVLALVGNTWSVTLLGVSGHTEADFYAQTTFPG